MPAAPRHRRPILVAAVASGLALALVATGCQRAPRPHVEVRGWAGQALTCARPPVTAMQRGSVVRLGVDAAAVLAAAGCVQHGNRHAPVLVAGERHLLLATDDDRFDVGLVGDADHGRTLVAELQVPGADCAVTADWRGHLVLLLEGPGDDGRTPDVRLDVVPLDC